MSHFRAHGRYRVDLGATLLDGEGRAQRVTLRDLGLGGAGIEVAEPDPASLDEDSIPLEPDVPVVLEVTVPTLWDPLRLPGKIAWVRRGVPGGRRARAGLRFEHHDAAALFSLFQVLGTQLFGG
jgi:hypothetical protein